MKYAFERLDQLINEKMNPGMWVAAANNEEFVNELIAAVTNEVEAVRKYLMRCSFEYMREKALELLVQQCQGGIITLLDLVYRYKTLHPDHFLQSAYEQIMKLLEEILTHIERRYTQYFNQDANVPELYLQLMQEETGEQYKKLQNTGRFRQIDPGLLQLTLDPLQLFSKNKWGASITYRGMLYIKELLNELLETESPVKGGHTEETLILMLTYLNFNTPTMIRQITGVLQYEINQLQDSNAREERLEHWQKELNQCQVKPGLAAISNYASVKEQVSAWVAEELQYFEKRQQRLFVEPKWQPAPQTIIELLSMSLPVSCLGILVRAATEEGLVMNESVDGAMEKASRIFTTPGTMNKKKVSGESMRIKSYNPSKRDKDRVIAPLYGMIRRIGKY